MGVACSCITEEEGADKFVTCRPCADTVGPYEVVDADACSTEDESDGDGSRSVAFQKQVWVAEDQQQHQQQPQWQRGHKPAMVVPARALRPPAAQRAGYCPPLGQASPPAPPLTLQQAMAPPRAAAGSFVPEAHVQVVPRDPPKGREAPRPQGQLLPSYVPPSAPPSYVPLPKQPQAQLLPIPPMQGCKGNSSAPASVSGQATPSAHSQALSPARVSQRETLTAAQKPALLPADAHFPEEFRLTPPPMLPALAGGAGNAKELQCGQTAGLSPTAAPPMSTLTLPLVMMDD
mmetsp:Transcript_12829/g.35206  ORF Transcript_12829/g.35206 Transcript_12829/m.35206 type:complete len:290 (-) Transcript_12829:100-969(-)